MAESIQNQQVGISFDDTEVAFRSKSIKDLRRSFLLFKVIGYNFLVKIGPALVEAAFSLKLPVKGIIKATVFKQFCGGETIESCNKVIDHLHEFGIGSILDYSVEGKETESEFDHSKKETIKTILKAHNNHKIPFCVFKVTGIARFALLEKVNNKTVLTSEEQEEFDRIRHRTEEICREAHDNNVSLFIDAEESWIQDPIDTIAREMMLKFNREKTIVYNTIQFYRHNGLAFLKQSFEDALKYNYYLGIKLVRGAYMEKERERASELGYENPIQPDKAATDAHYDEALRFCMDRIDRINICAGTHNEKSSMLLVQLMHAKGLAPQDKRICFSQLYGMSDHISFNLSDKGYNVAKYLPYGPISGVLPYLFRRAQENTSVKGQAGRELALITRELERRKTKH